MRVFSLPFGDVYDIGELTFLAMLIEIWFENSVACEAEDDKEIGFSLSVFARPPSP